MAEFRTASGLVATTPYIRTASGLVDAETFFRGPDGLIEGGGGEASALTVAASPDSVFGTGRGQTVTTGIVSASAAGGTAPYIFAWSLVDARGVWSATNPAGQTTAFRADDVMEGEVYTATFACTAADANGRTGTATVEAQAYRYGANDGTL